MKDLQVRDVTMVNLQLITLTLYIDQMLLVEGKSSQTIPVMGLRNT